MSSDEVKRKSGALEVIASAPTKAILFGEHAVVYGTVAVALSVGLRTYAHAVAEPGGSQLRVVLPDVNVSASFDLTELRHALENESVRSELLERQHRSVAAVLAVFFFVTSSKGAAVERTLLPLVLTVSAPEVPMGAGLGSSASLSVACAAAFMTSCRVRACETVSGVFCASCMDGRVCEPRLELICQAAFEGEKVLHSRPSGIDNTICTYGGAVAFARGSPPKRLMSPPFRLLITNTNVSRNTAKIVAMVRERKEKGEDGVEEALQRIGAISMRAVEMFQTFTEGKRREFLQELGSMFVENHELLVKLGTSHPALEQVVSICNSQSIPVPTKLTGAGGGGCTLSLLPDRRGVWPTIPVLPTTENGDGSGPDSRVPEDCPRRTSPKLEALNCQTIFDVEETLATSLEGSGFNCVVVDAGRKRVRTSDGVMVSVRGQNGAALP